MIAAGMVLLLGTPDAAAQFTRDCLGGEAPATHVLFACDNGLYPYGSHCVGFHHALTCSNDTGGSNNTEMWAVTDYAQSSTDDISVWGTDSVGKLWCCVGYNLSPGTTINHVELQGTDQKDDYAAQSGAHQLDVDVLYMYALADADTLAGSDTVTNEEYLNGYGGADTLDGGDGVDTLDGGAGIDTCNGGDGDDTIYGGDGGDDGLHGNAGNDTIYGEAGNDIATGGDRRRHRRWRSGR